MGLAIAPAGAGITTAVSLEEIKLHLNIESSTDDAELQLFLAAAEAAVAHRTGPLVPVAVTEKHRGGGACIVLKRPRAISLTSISYADGSAATLSDYDLDGDTGIVYWNYGTTGRFPGSARNVTITYTAGFSDLPEDLKFGVMDLVRWMWTTQRGEGSTSRPAFPGDDIDSGGPVVPSFMDWPPHVRSGIAPYSAPKVA